MAVGGRQPQYHQHCQTTACLDSQQRDSSRCSSLYPVIMHDFSRHVTPSTVHSVQMLTYSQQAEMFRFKRNEDLK